MKKEIKEDNRGGRREGAGRKPLPEGERRDLIWFSPTIHQIEFLGGKDACKIIALRAVEREYKRKLKPRDERITPPKKTL